MSLYVAAVDAESLAALTEDSAVDVLLEGWSADQFGWAAAGLLFGEQGVAVFGHSASGRFGPQVQVVSPLVLGDLATHVADSDKIGWRFEAGEFGQELGPSPSIEDQDWFVESTKALHALLREAEQSDKTVLFGFF